jgi:hypothetical protein
MNDLLTLQCEHCHAITVVDQNQQRAMLDQLTRPAQAIVLECRCGHFQFALSARKPRAPARQA